MDSSARDLAEQGSKLFSQKLSLDQFNQEVAELFYPERADFTVENPLGKQFGSHLFENSTIMMRRELGESFSSMLRPDAQPWFKSQIAQERQPAAGSEESHYLEYHTIRTRQLISDRRMNFETACKNAEHDFAAFGNAVISRSDRADYNGLVLKNCHLRDTAWTENDYSEVNKVYHKKKITITDLAYLFGDKKVPPSLRKYLEKDPDYKVNIMHIAMDAECYERIRTPPKGKKWPFVSLWICQDTETVLKEQYVQSLPYTVFRWQRVAGQYGVSPAVIAAMPSARMIQRMAYVLIQAAELTVDPPVVARDGVFKDGIALGSADINWLSAEYDERLGDALKPVEFGKNINIGMDMLNYVNTQLQQAFYLNKLRLPSSSAKTAYETARLVEQYVRDALPLFRTMEYDYLSPLMDGIAEDAMRLKLYGEYTDIPRTLAGKDIKFTFNNPLKQAVEQAKVKAFSDTANIFGTAMQIDPSVRNDIDMPKMFRETVEATGAPVGWLVPPEQAEQAKQMQAQQEQAARTLQGVQAASQTTQGLAQSAAAMQQAGFDPADMLKGLSGEAPANA